MIATSISLPEQESIIWQANRKQIMTFLDRYLLTQKNKQPNRSSARRYNKNQGGTEIIPVRFSERDYNLLHFVAAVIRVSVSSLIYGLIKLWMKPIRQIHKRSISINYYFESVNWDEYFGSMKEFLSYWVNYSSQ